MRARMQPSALDRASHRRVRAASGPRVADPASARPSVCVWWVGCGYAARMTDLTAQIVRVVVVSPGGVAPERDAVVSVVDELNRRVAPDKRCQLSVWRWETDARPGLHLEGPRGPIDERMQIHEADIVIGIFGRALRRGPCLCKSLILHAFSRASLSASRRPRRSRRPRWPGIAFRRQVSKGRSTATTAMT